MKADNIPAGDHFGDNQRGPEFMGKLAKRQICDPGQGSQHHPISQFYWSYPQCHYDHRLIIGQTGFNSEDGMRKIPNCTNFSHLCMKRHEFQWDFVNAALGNGANAL